MTSRGLVVMAAVAGAVLVAGAVPASAQRMPRVGACFYEDANFRGDYFCAEAGDELDELVSGANDEVSSIRILGGAEVTVFRDRRFRGRSRTYTSDIRNLDRDGWNDEISSVRIEGRFGGGPGFGGNRPGFGGGANVDRVIRRAYQDILDREPDAAGMREYRRKMIDDGWSEQQVREALRRSPEYREKNTMTRAKAEQIVRQAYLNVLRREPDPGSRTYVDKVLRERWTQQRVEGELRKSDEYRKRPRG
ncbi:MAG: peptidase inhibitor family I36 protein [Vicinamibacterales bacterium]